jgi:uncharacterized protein (DUF58 family)
MQFKEFRHYEAGDDIRHMSWTVTARTGKPTLKTYEEERELDIILVTDVSSSTLSNVGASRLHLFSELASVIGLATLGSGDHFGLLLFDSVLKLYLPPRKNRNQLLSALTHLLGYQSFGNQSDIRSTLIYLRRILKKKTVIVVLSDFWMPKFDQELAELTQKHEVVLIRTSNAWERGESSEGVFELYDPENQRKVIIDTFSKSVRNDLKENFLSQQRNLVEVCQKTRSRFLALNQNEDYLQKMVRFFGNRLAYQL